MLLDAFSPSLGDVFEILTAGSVIGTFAEEYFPSLADGLLWSVVYTETSVNLEVLAQFLDADFDTDGDVDGDDFLIWQSSFNNNDGGDADGDGDTDGDDFLLWQSQFGSMAGGSGSVTAVPEPSTWIMVILGIVAMRFRRHSPAVASNAAGSRTDDGTS